MVTRAAGQRGGVAMVAAWWLTLASACWSRPADTNSEPSPQVVAKPEVVASGPGSAGRDAPAIVPCGDEVVDGCFIPLPAVEALLGAQEKDETAPGWDPFAFSSEGPVRRASIGPFWMAAVETSISAWRRCVEAGSCPEVAEHAGQDKMAPAIFVTQAEAAGFCAWMGARLPSEDEFERAMRGANGDRFPWGNLNICPQIVMTQSEQVKERRRRILGHCKYDLLPMMDDAHQRVAGRIGPSVAPDDVKVACDVPTAEEAFDRLMALMERRRGELMSPRVLPDCGAMGSPTVVDDDEGGLTGLRHLATNVSEWTASVWRPAHGSDPVPGQFTVKGGSYTDSKPVAWRGAWRFPAAADARSPVVGFRCVVDLPPP